MLCPTICTFIMVIMVYMVFTSVTRSSPFLDKIEYDLIYWDKVLIGMEEPMIDLIKICNQYVPSIYL